MRLWSATDGTEIAVLRGHTDIVRAVAFSPDGTTLATGGDDKTIRLWPIDVEALIGNEATPPAPLPKPFTDFTADPERLARFLARLTFRHREGMPLLETLEPGLLSDLLRAANLLTTSSPTDFAEQILQRDAELKTIFDPPALWLAWITRVRRHKLERLGRECIALAERAASAPDPSSSLSEISPVTAPEAASEVSPQSQTGKGIETPSPPKKTIPQKATRPTSKARSEVRHKRK